MIAAGTESHFSLRVCSLVDCDHHLVEAIHPRINVQIILAGEEEKGHKVGWLWKGRRSWEKSEKIEYD